MKSYLSKLGVLLFGAMFAVAACQDYDEEIRKVNDKLTADKAELTEITEELDKAIAALEEKHDADLAKVNADLKGLADELAAAEKALEEAYKAADADLKKGYEDADKDLQAKINKAVEDATAAIAGLQSALDAAKVELKKGYEDADAALRTEVLAYVDNKVAALKSELQTLIDAKVAELKAADAALADAIKAEQAAREAGDKKLADELKAAKEEAAKNLADAKAEIAENLKAAKDELLAADAALKAQIEEVAADVAKNAEKIAELADELKAAKEELQGAIDAEEEARISGDAQTLEDAKAYTNEKLADAIATLTEKHDAEIAEVKGLIESAKAALQAAITAEETARKAADVDLQAAIEAEEAARSVADSTLAASIESLRGELEDYIEKTDKKIAALEDADKTLQDNIDKVAAALDEFKKKADEIYATKEELSAEKARLDELYQHVTDIKHDVANEFQGVLATIENLNKRLQGLEVDVEALMGRIQSLVFAPDYTRHVALIDYAVVPSTKADTAVKDLILPKLSLIRYKVNAVEAAAEAEKLAAAWAASETPILSYTLESVAQTRAAVEGEEELVIHNVEAEGEYLHVWVTAENFPKNFYYSSPNGTIEAAYYAASLRYSDGNNERATEYVNIAAIDEPMTIEVMIQHVEEGDPMLEYDVVDTALLAVNDVDTILAVLEGYEPVLVSGGAPLTEKELALLPSTEILFKEVRDYTDNAKTDKCIDDNSFKFTGKDMTETVQLAAALNKDYVGELLDVARTYSFGPSVATATYTVRLTAERRETTIVPEVASIDWTLQRALDLGDKTAPYSKTLTVPAKYEFSYNLNNVFNSADLIHPLVTKVTCNGKPTTAWVGLTNYEGTAPNFTVLCNLHNYEFPAPGEKPNVYRVEWQATLGDYLFVVADVEITLNPRPETVEIEREVALELVPGTTYFDGVEALVADAYEELGVKNAGFNETNLAKVNDVMLAVLNDNKPFVNKPSYETNLNFQVDANVDNSFVRLYNEQIAKNILNPEGYVFERTIDTWFGVDFVYTITAKPELPKNYLIPSEDFMTADENGVKYVEVFGKINSEGVYTIDLADLGKYLGVTIGEGDDKDAVLEHELDVIFDIDEKFEVKLAADTVAVTPLANPVPEKFSGTLNFAELENDKAVVDWDQYAGTVVDVKASLLAENTYILDELDFQLRTKDPLTFEFGDTVRVTRVPGLSASAKVYENVVLTSSVEPSWANLVNQNAATLQEIFANSHADKTYGIKPEVSIWGVYTDEAMTVPYSEQKWTPDNLNGTITLHADDGQLLYPLYAKATLSFTHNIHGACTAKKDIIVVFEPSEEAKVMMNKFTNGGEIKLEENLLLTQPLVIDNPNAVVTLDLGGRTIQNITRERDSEQYALRVKQGTLIIKGEGTVDGGSGCLYNIALRVDGGAVAYVEGGYFKVGADQDGDQNHAVYAADGGQVYISGGKFQSAPKKGSVPAVYTTLNLKDGTGAKIEVTGGEFVNFNPADNVSEGPGTNFVKTGYKAILKQYSTTDYIVVAE